MSKSIRMSTIDGPEVLQWEEIPVGIPNGVKSLVG
jgi:hypothetical protein